MHQWSTTPLNNQTADSRANWQEGQPASSLNNSARGMMATAAFWRDDNLGLSLTAVAGASNVYTLTTGQGLIDPATISSTPAITHAFSLRVNFGTAPTGLATNPLKLAIDGAAAATVTRADGSALVDGDIVTAKSYPIVGYAFTNGALSQIRIISILPSEVNAAADARINSIVPPLIAALGTPVQRAGDTMTGDLTVSKTAPAVKFSYPGVTNMGWRLDSDAHLRWYNFDTGNSLFDIGPSGAVAIGQFGDLNSRIESRASALATQQAQAYSNNCVQSMRFVFAGDLYNSWMIDAQFHSPFGGYACIVDRTTFYENDGTWNIGLFRWRYLQMYIPNQGWVTVTAAS